MSFNQMHFNISLQRKPIKSEFSFHNRLNYDKDNSFKVNIAIDLKTTSKDYVIYVKCWKTVH